MNLNGYENDNESDDMMTETTKATIGLITETTKAKNDDEWRRVVATYAVTTFVQNEKSQRCTALNPNVAAGPHFG